MKVVVVYLYNRFSRRQEVEVYADGPLDDVEILWEKNADDHGQVSRRINAVPGLKKQYSECFDL